ncbi:MAG: polysaccharide pyruvyl transferase family protein [Rheinheimera sp.]|nr:MAG: polysaccharide pyruvyl transferase family protein [Rheinheimera sp.]
MLILIKGVQFINKGALLMLYAVLEQTRQQWPDAEIAVELNPNSPFLKRAQLGLLQHMPLRFRQLDLNWLSYLLPEKLRAKLRFYLGIVFEADIDLLLDASGFAYGDQWPVADLQRLCGQIHRLKAHGRKVVLLPQAFGPFGRAQDRQLIRRHFGKVDLICARDQASERFLTEIGAGAKNIRQYPDFTISLQGTDCDDAQYVLQKPAVIIPNYQMLRAGSAWQADYESTLERIAQVLQRSGQMVVLINHEGLADMAICQRLAARLNPAPQILQIEDPRLLKGYIKASSLVVSSRFHGCVSALASGVPCIGTSWSHKYQALFDDFAAPDALLKPGSDEEMLQAVIDYAFRVVTTAEYQQRIQQLTEQNRLMWQQISSVFAGEM